MFELTTILAVFVSVNLVAYYVASEVYNFPPLQFLAAIVGAALLSVTFAKALVPNWTLLIRQIMNREKRLDELKDDLVGVVLVFLAASAAHLTLMTRRYGPRRVLTILAVNTLISMFV